MDEERVKKFIKAYEEIKEQSFIIANINKDFFFEFAECLIKRIKELEEENVILRKANNITKDLIKEVKIEDITQVINKSYEEFVNQFIAKQKVKDKIKELANIKGDFATYIAVSERIKVLEELLEEKQ